MDSASSCVRFTGLEEETTNGIVYKNNGTCIMVDHY